MNTELKTEIENHLSEISLVNEKTHIIEKIEGVIKEKYSIDCFLDFLKGGNDNNIDSNVILSLLLEKIGEQNIDNLWNGVDESDKDIINLYKKKKNIADENKQWIKIPLIHLFLVFICKLIDTYFDRIVLKMGIFDIDAYCKAILYNCDSCFSEENSKKLIRTRWECGEKAFSVDDKNNYPDGKFVLIYGVAGAGKTWLLKKILCEICRNSIESDIDKKCIPIYIELRKYNEWDYNNSDNKKTIMQSMIQNLLEIDSEEYTKLLDKFVLLMDGYDEIYDVSDSNSHKNDLTKFFIQTKPHGTRCIVTSRKEDKNIFGSSTTPQTYKFKNVDCELVKDYFNEYVDDAYRKECIDKLKGDLSWISQNNNIIPVMLEAMVVQINNNNIDALINQKSFDRIFLIHLLRREIEKNGEQYVKNLNKIMIALAQGTKNGNTGYAREDIEPQLSTVSISGEKGKLDYIVEALYIPLLRIEENNKYYFENENYINYFLDENLFELNGALK